METATITILVPKYLREEFKIVAAKKRKSMTDILLETIRREVNEDKKNEIKR
jgi:hypothetical protein